MPVEVCPRLQLVSESEIKHVGVGFVFLGGVVVLHQLFKHRILLCIVLLYDLFVHQQLLDVRQLHRLLNELSLSILVYWWQVKVFLLLRK